MTQANRFRFGEMSDIDLLDLIRNFASIIGHTPTRRQWD